MDVAILHGTAVCKKIGRYRKIILRYDYKAGILLSTTSYPRTLSANVCCSA